MFQFNCPNGHLMQADPQHAGENSACPVCGIALVIPSQAVPVPNPAVQPAGEQSPATGNQPTNVPPPPPPSHQQTSQSQSKQSNIAPSPFSIGQAHVKPPATGQVPIGSMPVINRHEPVEVGSITNLDKPEELSVLHIPCPNGHELETPREMLNKEAMCPFCDARFHLLERSSVEFIRKKELAEQLEDHRAGKHWLNWAIIFIVIAVLLFGLMFIVAWNNS